MMLAAALPTLAAAAPALTAGAAVVGGVNTFLQQRYQAQVAENNSIIMERQAEVESDAAQLDAQDSDFARAQEIGQVTAAAGASGASVDSFSFFARRRAMEAAAGVDRERLTVRGRQRVTDLQNSAADARASASNLRSGAMFSLIGGGLNAAGALLPSFGVRPSTATRLAPQISPAPVRRPGRAHPGTFMSF